MIWCGEQFWRRRLIIITSLEFWSTGNCNRCYDLPDDCVCVCVCVCVFVCVALSAPHPHLHCMRGLLVRGMFNKVFWCFGKLCNQWLWEVLGDEMVNWTMTLQFIIVELYDNAKVRCFEQSLYSLQSYIETQETIINYCASVFSLFFWKSCYSLCHVQPDCLLLCEGFPEWKHSHRQ